VIRSNHGRERRLVCVAGVALFELALVTVAHEAAGQCVGDCDGSGTVTVDDVITMVNVALGTTSISGCDAGAPGHTGTILINDVVTAVNNSLHGCPTAPSTPTPTPTGNRAGTPVPAGAGLSSSISAVAISADGQIVVTFSLTDAAGTAITPVLTATQDPNQAHTRFAIAHIENYSGGGEINSPFSRYVNDVDATRPRYDSGGDPPTTLNAAAGIFTYTFRAKLPQGFDPTLTYIVGMQVDRTFGGQQLGANPVSSVVPSGGTPQTLLDVTTQQCNSCHQPLIAHGNRREVALCVLCHTEAAVDAKGTTIDFRNMIHKIHAGRELPSIVSGSPGSTYQVCGSRGCDVFAQKDANGRITGVGFPRSIEECVVCHADGPTASHFKDRPASAACAACHDDVNPSESTTGAGPPGTKHFEERGYPDGDCSFCHRASSGKEFDVTVAGAHTVPARSKQLQGLNIALVDVINHAAGQTPTFRLKVTNNAGTPLTTLSDLERLGFAMSGPTTEYTVMITATAVGDGATGNLAGPDADGVFQYIPEASARIPENATGTWAVGAEARRPVTLTTVAPILPKTVEEAAPNPVITFTVDDATAVMRRAIVDDDSCATCHGQFSKDFSIHGSLRNRTEYCVICHNPNQSDYARRKLDATAVAAAAPVASIDFKVMIHKIHRGEALERQPYLIYGFGLPPPGGTGYTLNDFGDVRYPGDLRICQTCHLDSTYLLPPYPTTALAPQVAHIDPANASLVVDGYTAPITSVCTGCHDGDEAVAHAETQTASGGTEACTVCHEEGRAFAVSALHAGRR